MHARNEQDEKFLLDRVGKAQLSDEKINGRHSDAGELAGIYNGSI